MEVSAVLIRIIAKQIPGTCGASLPTIIWRNIHFPVSLFFSTPGWQLLILYSVFENVNKSLPWDYDFRFVIEEINNINDKAQVGRTLHIK